MTFPTLNLTLSRRRYEEMVVNNEFLPTGLTAEQQRLRGLLLAEIPFYKDGRDKKLGAGLYDIEVGNILYRILASEGMSLRTAADDGFWRFLSLKLVPDLVKSRWENGSAVRYWQGRSRIWLRATWWTVHLTWQGTEEATKAVLKTVTTDTVVQLVERPGRSGFRVELTRSLFMERYLRKPSQDQFRAVMKLNTAKVLVVEPSCCEGGLEGYAKALFNEAGCLDTRLQLKTEK
ncbi:hypothetical protein IMF27_07205 [Pseudomonas sp. PCH199]|uniref:hypothetical protein n=1 Tax=unclassified Pseudomonas TaxID=196821 RepID=UPI000BC4C7AB|nr:MULTISPECIES: hypothetical protein [unclassified Pseudomonas]MCW8275513.1 hypothetical protein [Pseudomonas sp. PCH199]PAM84387.1 hypothetical protein CES87_07405 [Pseudomonas sp. ERMR1:02]